ncbi:MAG: hypothetical protein A2X55_07800 [Nitrospirae bacterium GWB2_47_37]|nr:MAG: hypothetical protein A2X55_07800 [Nitrospirae bacterium GWB2_47_37]
MRNALLILIIGAIAYTLLNQKKTATVQLTGSGPLTFQKLYNTLFSGTSNGTKVEDTQYYRDAFEAWDSMPQSDKDVWFAQRTVSA